MRRGGVSFIPKMAKRGALDGCHVLAIKERETSRERGALLGFE
jgi:hypothetical protein